MTLPVLLSPAARVAAPGTVAALMVMVLPFTVKVSPSANVVAAWVVRPPVPAAPPLGPYRKVAAVMFAGVLALSSTADGETSVPAVAPKEMPPPTACAPPAAPSDIAAPQ